METQIRIYKITFVVGHQKSDCHPEVVEGHLVKYFAYESKSRKIYAENFNIRPSTGSG